MISATHNRAWIWTARIVIVAYSLFAATFKSFTVGSTAAIVVPGIILFAIGIVKAPSQRPQPRFTDMQAMARWWILLLIFSLIEIVDDFLGSTYPHPTLSALIDPYLTSNYGWRLGLYLVWFFVGWALVKR